MKWLIASDIHGSEFYTLRLLKAFTTEKAQRMLLLGDLLYHGPRNDLPIDYNPKSVITLLNQHRDDILCVRGNCDSEVDQMVLDFPIMADYALLAEGTHTIFATHGHQYNDSHLPPLRQGDVLLAGHTHVAEIKRNDRYMYVNPGSVSLPKNGSYNGYMTFENGTFISKDFDGIAKMWDSI
jgi:hypothetical protein